jgi:bifunctional DNA-binding transcriptional regulator/antitoxin component of YhaV-PrlF toxin-antitoxin module
METTLGAHGEIGIPSQLREADHLDAGDRFEIERIVPGHYVLSKIAGAPGSFSICTAADGLPLIRAQGGTISAALVREIEGLAR